MRGTKRAIFTVFVSVLYAAGLWLSDTALLLAAVIVTLWMIESHLHAILCDEWTVEK